MTDPAANLPAPIPIAAVRKRASARGRTAGSGADGGDAVAAGVGTKKGTARAATRAEVVAAARAERAPLEVGRRAVEVAEDKKAADIVLLDLARRHVAAGHVQRSHRHYEPLFRLGDPLGSPGAANLAGMGLAKLFTPLWEARYEELTEARLVTAPTHQGIRLRAGDGEGEMFFWTRQGSEVLDRLEEHVVPVDRAADRVPDPPPIRASGSGSPV